VIGVLLSGGGDDGLIGLSHIKKRGGIVIVQDPEQAESPSMPESAIREIAVDHILRAEDMPAVISGLVRMPFEENVNAMNQPARDIAEAGTDALDTGELPGPPTPFRCPECGGALWEVHDGEIMRFQCYVGHAFNPESLAAAHGDGLEEALWTAIRALEENSALRRRMAAHARERGMTAIAAAYEEDAQDSEARAKLVRRVIVESAASERVPSV
jgi:two-component system chemotaxis response regulator CheB